MTKQKLIFLVLQNLLSRFLFESYWWVEGECFMISFSVSCITTLSSIVFATTLMENINSKNRSFSIVSNAMIFLWHYHLETAKWCHETIITPDPLLTTYYLSDSCHLSRNLDIFLLWFCKNNWQKLGKGKNCRTFWIQELEATWIWC